MREPRSRRLIIAVAILAAAGLVSWRVLEWTARWLVVRQADGALDTPVDLDRAAIGVFPPRLQLDGLRISNPPGYGAEPLLVVDRLMVRVEPSTLAADVIRVSEVSVDGFVMRLEREGGRTNEALRQRVLGQLGGKATSSRRVVIGRLSVRSGRVNAPAPLGRRLIVPVKDIELRDVGRQKDGLTTTELADLAFRLMEPGLRHALRSVDVGGFAKGLFR